MLNIASNTLLPSWLVLPIAGAAMLVIAGHILAMQGSNMARSRLRIRTANGVLMLVVTAMLAYALSIMRVTTMQGSHAETREFILVWMMIMGLLPIVILLAGVDVCNSLRLHTAARRDMRRQLRTKLMQEVVVRKGALGGRREVGAGGGRDDRRA